VLDQNGEPAYFIPHTGDSAFVAMNPYRRRSANAKLTYSRQNFKLSYGVFWDDNWNKYYDHGFAWNPDGISNHYRTSMIHSLQATYMLTNDTYTSLKGAYNKFDYWGHLYEDPFDPRYVDPAQGGAISNYTFRSGGNHGDRYNRYSETLIGQWQLNSQLTNTHKIGIGIEGRRHNIYSHGQSIMNRNTVETDSLTGALLFEIGYPNLGTQGNQEYLKHPIEVSAYIQDKMEYDIMIINAGLRFDYFDPYSSYPLDLRNPTQNPLFPNPTALKRASAKLQVSPRLGVSFPITDEGIIHFSYGHFFQIPSFENLYLNSDYLVTPGSSLSSIIGNPDLEAQRTVMYELGLQQVLFGVIGLDFSVYSRDIRNLLGMEILSTYEGFRYARFINRDYGNVKGFIFSLDKRFSDYYSVRFDYTYQIAEGNASDPYAEFQNNQSDPPIETNKKVVPLNWDQRSTFSLSFSVGEPGNWTAGAIMQYGTGFPYTEDIRVSNGLRFENGGVKPSTFNVDLRADKSLSFGGVNVSLFALVYNLLDTKNENNVDAASGRTNIDLYTYQAGRLIGLNTIEEYVNNPANFSAPRQVRIGMSLNF
jgi:outer membrane receptor protein involved in Fe transport